jgi:hypothetical protein
MRARRKRLAGVLPLRRAHPVCRAGARSRNDLPLPTAASRKARQLQQNIETRLGRTMVSPRLVRQRRTARLPHQSGMSDRFPAAKLVGDQRRRRSAAFPPGDERRGPAPDPPRRRADPVVRSALRHSAQSRLHQGLHPGVRENGGQYTHGAIWTAMAFALMGENERAWELFTLLNPVHHGGTPEADRHLQSRALRRRRGRLCRRAAHRPGRMDVVYRFRRLDVPPADRNPAGREPRGRSAPLDSPRSRKAWSSCKIHYRYRQTVYHITITRTLTLPCPCAAISLPAGKRRERGAERRELLPAGVIVLLQCYRVIHDA